MGLIRVGVRVMFECGQLHCVKQDNGWRLGWETGMGDWVETGMGDWDGRLGREWVGNGCRQGGEWVETVISCVSVCRR